MHIYMLSTYVMYMISAEWFVTSTKNLECLGIYQVCADFDQFSQLGVGLKF